MRFRTPVRRFGPVSSEDFSFTEFVAATFNRKKCLTEKVGRVIFNSACLSTGSGLLKARLRQEHGREHSVERAR